MRKYRMRDLYFMKMMEKFTYNMHNTWEDHRKSYIILTYIVIKYSISFTTSSIVRIFITHFLCMHFSLDEHNYRARVLTPCVICRIFCHYIFFSLLFRMNEFNEFTGKIFQPNTLTGGKFQFDIIRYTIGTLFSHILFETNVKRVR